MAIKEFIRDYLNFTRKERIGISVIVILFFIIMFFPFLTGHIRSKKDINADSSWATAMRKLEVKNPDIQDDEKKTKRPYSSDDKIVYHNDYNIANASTGLFYFDPNTLSPDGWRKLGIREKTITTIQNYLSKGGVFRKAGDLQKVYGLHKIDYDRIAPYFKIEKIITNNSSEEFSSTKNATAKKVTLSYSKVIDINTTDTTGLIELPGIGSKLALRIINFRDKLGGFYSIDQVKETYGVADSVFQKIKSHLRCEDNSIKKININTATKDELKSHPYIRWNNANAIVEFRNQHGLFSTIEDLKKIQSINDETFNKIKPYLVL